jgi:hypothetical protein
MVTQSNTETVFFKNVVTGKYLVMGEDGYAAQGSSPQAWTLEPTGDEWVKYFLVQDGQYLNPYNKNGSRLNLVPSRHGLDPDLIGFAMVGGVSPGAQTDIVATFGAKSPAEGRPGAALLAEPVDAVVLSYDGDQPGMRWTVEKATTASADTDGSPGTVAGDTVPITSADWAIVTAINNEQWDRTVRLQGAGGGFEIALKGFEAVLKRVQLRKGELQVAILDSKNGALGLRHTRLEPLGNLTSARKASTITFVGRKASADETSDVDVVVHIDWASDALKRDAR